MHPIDDLHAECIRQQAITRAEFEAKRAECAAWEPRPCPP